MVKCRRIIAKVLILIMIGSFVFPYINGNNSLGASKRPKFSVSKITVTTKKTKSIFVKNAKKAKFTWKSKNKKYATVKSIGKGKAKITGVKKGNTKITCKVVLKKKKYNLTCSVKVIEAPKNSVVKTERPLVSPVASSSARTTVSPTASPTVRPTVTPTANPTASPTVKPTVTPTARPTASPTVRPTVTPTTNPTASPTVNPTAAPTIKPTTNPTANPTVAPAENPTQPTIPVGYKAVDLSTFTSSDNSKVSYDSVTGVLKVTGSLNALNFALDNVLNAGEQIHLIVQGSHEGTSSFRCMLGNNTTGVSNTPTTNGQTGDGLWPKYYGFLWQYTMKVTTGNTANLFMFKGSDGGTNLDNLTIYSILIKYGGEPEPSLYKLQPTVDTKPVAQAITYGNPLSSATLSGGVAKYGDVTVEGTFSWYSPTTIPAGGTNSYTVLFTPSGAFASLYNTAVCQLSVTPTGYTENSNDVLYQNFDDGSKGTFTDRWATAVIDDNGYSGKCLKGTNRNASYMGLQVDITSLIQEGNTYSISAYGKTAAGTTLNMSIVKTMGTDGYDGIDTKTPNGGWVELSGKYTVPYGCTKFILFFQTDEAGKTNDIFIDEVKITQTNIPIGEKIVGSLKDSYTPIFGYVGGAIPYASLKSEKHMNFVKSQFNSISMENEMKPNEILGSSATTQASLPSGYIANEKYEYKETSYPKLNFSVVDDCINLAYNAGVKMRFHVLLWHAQTPKWFFTENFSPTGNYVSTEVMNGRLEYFIRNVMNHVYNTEHGKDVVYCWDVVNEYTHNYDGGQKSFWDQVYYPEYTYNSTKHSGIWNPSYVIDAFTIADDQLSKLETQGKIPDADAIDLFYNDYNEYIETDNIIKLIANINENKKVCDGVGMQMHLNVSYPNPSATGEISKAIDKFNKAGLKMQLTEIDVTYYPNKPENVGYSYENQISYWDTLFKMIVAKKNSGANITGITFWGLDDASSWRKDGTPLLFDSLLTAKPMYFNVLAAANNYYG